MPRKRRNSFPDLSKEAKAGEKFFRGLPRIIGNMAKNFYDDSWKREGFIDKRIEKWPRRSSPDKGKGRRRTLVKTGRLRRSIRMRVSGSRVTIFTEVPYAKIHNEGGKVTGTANVKAHTRKIGKGRKAKKVPVKAHKRRFNYTMPKRQFMGESDLLNRRIIKNVEQQLEKTFN